MIKRKIAIAALLGALALSALGVQLTVSAHSMETQQAVVQVVPAAPILPPIIPPPRP